MELSGNRNKTNVSFLKFYFEALLKGSVGRNDIRREVDSGNPGKKKLSLLARSPFLVQYADT